MATVNYFIKGVNEPKAVYLRLRDSKIDLKVPTGYFIDSKNWSVSKKEVNQKASFGDKLNLTNNLKDLKSFVFDAYNNQNGTGIQLNPNWLNTVIKTFKNPNTNDVVITLLSSIEDYKERMKYKTNPRTNKPTSSDTIRSFNTTIQRVKLFSEYRKQEILLTDVDLSFHDEFVKYLINERGLSANSIGTSIKQIKTVCSDAFDRGQTINLQVKSKKFNVLKEDTLFVTLNRTDLQKIKGFKGSNHLNNARDWLLIGCWTGCRVSDLMKLSNSNIMRTPKGLSFIRYTQNKTGKQVDIPVHKDVQEIIKKLNGFPRPISDVNFNKYIKDVCKLSGINETVHGTRQNPKTHIKEVGNFEKWELVRSHTCRRSFATNHYNEVSNKLIMAVTGHTTEKMLLKYIGETENAHIEDFINAWGNDKEQEQKVKPINAKTA